MTNTEELSVMIEKSGLKKSYIHSSLGISAQGFLNKLNNKCEFKPTEITKLCILLGISTVKQRDKIFFAPDVPKVNEVEERGTT